jgi:hypothetical protein
MRFCRVLTLLPTQSDSYDRHAWILTPGDYGSACDPTPLALCQRHHSSLVNWPANFQVDKIERVSILKKGV